MNPRSAEIDEDTIDIKEVFQTVFRFRYMIVFIVVLFGLGSSYYAYFKPDIYQASATVEVGLEQRLQIRAAWILPLRWRLSSHDF
jgi:uncharacterized protein involved in exopolysaccharide biosynthesis